MQSLVNPSFSVKSESDGEFQDSSQSASDLVSKNINENNLIQWKQASLRCSSRFQPPVVLLLLAFLLGVSTGNHPLLFAEAGAATGAMTTFSPTKSKAFINRSPPSQPNPLYAFGNFGHKPEHVCLARRCEAKVCRLVDEAKDALLIRWERFLADLTISKVFGWALKAGRTWVFWFFSKDCLASIYEDRWHAERDPDKFFGNEGMWISKGAHKDVVKRRIQRSRRNRQWVGLGYTPRLVWLVGVLLRGTFQCTAIPKVFNPSLTGWGAGTILGAKCTHQEWIATFMIGWFGSEHYWKYLFGCRGPPFAEPGFTGIPVFITKIRDVRL